MSSHQSFFVQRLQIYDYVGTNKANCRECGKRFKKGEKGKMFIYLDRGGGGKIWCHKPKYCYRCLVKLMLNQTSEDKITDLLTQMGLPIK
jgi:hypothetical protein